MIKNDQEKAISLSQMKLLQKALDLVIAEGRPDDMVEDIWDQTILTQKYFIAQMDDEITEYEKVKIIAGWTTQEQLIESVHLLLYAVNLSSSKRS